MAAAKPTRHQSYPAPLISGAPPAWITRTGNRIGERYALIEDRVDVIREICDLCIRGLSASQIVESLNARGILTFSFGSRAGEPWTIYRIALLLRNESLIGYYQPHRVTPDGKRKAIGQKIRIYPAAIDLATWQSVRSVLDSRSAGLRGRSGRETPNLFTSHAFCGECGRTLRCETSSPRNRKPWKRLICSGFRDFGTCKNGTRFDLTRFEPLILEKLQAFAPIDELVGPALSGDVDARAQLRSLLNRLDYRIDSQGKDMRLTVARTSEKITGID